MGKLTIEEWQELAQAYAFAGNSLLAPMSQTADVGLDPAFWQAFPSFGDSQVTRAAETCAAWAAERVDDSRDQRVTDVSVEYTHLFVGPPSPAAPPWETMNRADGAEVSVGFGEATFQMRAILRSLGLEASGPSNQYEDHIGLELLCLSEMCRRRAQLLATADGEDAAAVCEGGGESVTDALVAAFIADRPLAWIDVLSSRVEAACPQGYFAHLLALVRVLLVHQHNALS